MRDGNTDAVIEILTEKIKANDKKISEQLDDIARAERAKIAAQEVVEFYEAENWGFEFAITKLKGN